jgi:hypothetical protein
MIMFKMRKLTVTGIMVVMFFGMFPYSPQSFVHGQDEEEPIQMINGLTVPRIDGLMDKSSPLLSIDEWEDAPLRKANFLLSKPIGLDLEQDEPEEEPEIQTLPQPKWVAGNFYYALEFPRALDSFSLQFDMNHDGRLSNGDARLAAESPVINQKGIQLNPHFTSLDGIRHFQQRVFIFMDGAWWDPSELNPELWNTKDWDPSEFIKWDPSESGFSRYADVLSGVGQIRTRTLTNKAGAVEIIEARFSPAGFNKLVKLTSPNLLSSLQLNAIPTEEISYGVQVQTISGGHYGYPTIPNYEVKTNQYIVDGFITERITDFIPPFFQTDIGVDHIEVTQTIQTANNDLSLVQGKQSLARVFVDNPTGAPLDVEVKITGYAFALITIIELGSVSQTFSAPVSPDRIVLLDSANFDLPDEWVSIPWLFLKAEVTPIARIDTNTLDNSLTDAFTFRATHDLNIYYVRVNVGTAAVPSQVSQATADAITSAFSASYPVANPNYIQLDWSMLGAVPMPLDSEQLKADLTEVAGQLVIAILFQILFGVTDVLPVPDQIFGIVPSGGGSSTPSWGDGGESYASWGAPTATSGNLVMAHEVNHWNSNNPRPNLNADPNFGCGASGPDSAWPGTNDNINQLYTDALGWNPGTGLVQNTKDDLMSYCNGGTPAKWISDYRWEELVDRLESFVAGQPAHPTSFTFQKQVESALDQAHQGIDLDFTISSTRVISGFIHKDGSANLQPSYLLPGNFSKIPRVRPGFDPTHILEIELFDQSTQQFPILPRFDDHAENDHEPSDRYHFSFWIPDDGLITSVRVLSSTGQELDLLKGSGFSASGDVPIPGKWVRGQAYDLTWNIDLSNTTNVYAQLQYSHDSGHWFNLGKPTLSFEQKGIIISENMPGGKTAKLRLILTDGFDTQFIMSSASFDVPLLLPAVQIHRNNFWEPTEKGLDLDQIFSLADPRPSPLGSIISLSASSYDPQSGKLPGDSISWTVEQVDQSGVTLNPTEELFGNYHFFTHQFDQPGLYRISASVMTPEGIQVSDSIEIKVIGAAYVSVEDFKRYQTALQDAIDGITTTSQDSDKSESDDSPTLPIPASAVVIALVLVTLSRRVYLRKRR